MPHLTEIQLGLICAGFASFIGFIGLVIGLFFIEPEKRRKGYETFTFILFICFVFCLLFFIYSRMQ